MNSDMALNDPASYEKLLRDYQELQLRVTRFSAVEQQLKNANSQLDQELELHKKLQRYSFKALHVGSEEELLALMAESIIDVLEVEFSFVYVKYNAFPEKSLFKYEGFEYTGSTEFLHNSLPLLAKEKIAAGSYR
ncbi:MAG: hypothetical protein RJA57_184, partial [Bacteroidota bacterium]